MCLHSFNAHRFKHDRYLERELAKLRAARFKLLMQTSLCRDALKAETIEALNNIVTKHGMLAARDFVPMT